MQLFSWKWLRNKVLDATLKEIGARSIYRKGSFMEFWPQSQIFWCQYTCLLAKKSFISVNFDTLKENSNHVSLLNNKNSFLRSHHTLVQTKLSKFKYESESQTQSLFKELAKSERQISHCLELKVKSEKWKEYAE